MMITQGKKMPEIKLRGSLDAIKFPAVAQLKLDGEFCYLIKRRGDCYFSNKYGKERRGGDILNWCAKSGPDTYILLGELYCGNGKRGSLYDLLKNKDHEQLSFFPFDILEIEGEDLSSEPLAQRLEILYDRFYNNQPEGEFIGIQAMRIVKNKDEALEYFQEATNDGFEGIVVKGLNTGITLGATTDWVKVKYKDQSDFPVISIDPVKERCEVDVNGKAVGVKVCNKDKVNLKVGNLITVEHQGILAQGGLRHPAFKGVVTNGTKCSNK